MNSPVVPEGVKVFDDWGQKSQICKHVKKTDPPLSFLSGPLPMFRYQNSIPFIISAALRDLRMDKKKIIKTLFELCEARSIRSHHRASLPFLISAQIYLHSCKTLNANVRTRHKRTRSFPLLSVLPFLICCCPWLRPRACWGLLTNSAAGWVTRTRVHRPGLL